MVLANGGVLCEPNLDEMVKRIVKQILNEMCYGI